MTPLRAVLGHGPGAPSTSAQYRRYGVHESVRRSARRTSAHSVKPAPFSQVGAVFQCADSDGALPRTLSSGAPGGGAPPPALPIGRRTRAHCAANSRSEDAQREPLRPLRTTPTMRVHTRRARGVRKQ